MKLITNVPHIDKLIEEINKQAKEVKIDGLELFITTTAYCSTEEGTEGFVTVSTDYEWTGESSILETDMDTSFTSNGVEIYERLSKGNVFDMRFKGKLEEDFICILDVLTKQAKWIVDYLFSQGDFAPQKT